MPFKRLLEYVTKLFNKKQVFFSIILIFLKIFFKNNKRYSYCMYYYVNCVNYIFDFYLKKFYNKTKWENYMNEIINSILEAEKKSEEILKDASNNVKVISKECVAKSDSIKEEAITSFKLEKKKEIKSAEEKAEKEYNKKIETGVLEADSLINSVRSKIDNIVLDELKEIIG